VCVCVWRVPAAKGSSLRSNWRWAIALPISRVPYITDDTCCTLCALHMSRAIHAHTHTHTHTHIHTHTKPQNTSDVRNAWFFPHTKFLLLACKSDTVAHNFLGQELLQGLDFAFPDAPKIGECSLAGLKGHGLNA